MENQRLNGQPTSLSSYLTSPRFSSPWRRLGFVTGVWWQQLKNTPLHQFRRSALVGLLTALALTTSGLYNPLSELPTSAQAATIDSKVSDITPSPQVAISQLPGGPSGEEAPVQSATTTKPRSIHLASTNTYTNNYARGQCTWYVASRRPIPSSWGNANNWYRSAIAADWAVGIKPAIGAVAWTAAGRYGHVALVEDISTDGTQVYISEMNYQGLWVRSTRWANATDFRYIY